MRIIKEFEFNIQDGANLISEAFGLTDGHKVPICDIDIPEDWEVLFITGESGSGKTSILKELCSECSVSLPNIPLYLLNGETLEEQIECIKWLSICGLSDALQFVSVPSQLSDSQLARASIAYQLILGKETIVVDEFLSTLDRKTAKVVAFTIQKAIRKAGKKLIVTTAHEDIEEYLSPDYVITGKAYPSRFKVEKYTKSVYDFSKDVELHYGDKIEYRNCRLAELHYKGKYTGGAKDYLFATINDECVGVILGTYNRATGGRRISRVVVHPTYRGIGIGQMMVKQYLKDNPNTDVIATMALFNPVFSHAGMKRVKDSICKSPKGLEKKLDAFNFDSHKWHDKNYCISFCNNKDVRQIISEYSTQASDFICPGGVYLPEAEVKRKILEDSKTCGRVLFQLREKHYAKYVNSEEPRPQ